LSDTVAGTGTALPAPRDCLAAAAAQLRLRLGRTVRFAGAYPSREAALASQPAPAAATYDRDDIAEVSLTAMCRLAPWDYPVLYWLERLRAPHDAPLRLLDAGGHVGTKYIAFRDHLPLDRFDWAVWDLPALVRAGRAAQEAGRVPAALSFVDSPAQAGPRDLLLCSGLLQYFDRPLSALVAELAAPPPAILLNKVATRPGAEVVTLEQIGPARVPYRIRNRAAFEAELAAMGYAIADSWGIPELGHKIATHPWLGRSESRGYLLRRH
jgi:putative methyltransferase (TIGR04325 family)